jgi:SAM-dependent methyltransferase
MSDDAYGHEIYDAFLGKEVLEIVEREDGWIAASHTPQTYFAPFEEWPSIEQEAMGYVRGRALDIGCGAGRNCLYLQEQGFDVLGIDLSPLAVEVCKQRGVKNVLNLSITQVSRKLGQFDTILMMGNNFGLFGNARRAKWLLRRFYGMMSSEGWIIAVSNDPYTAEDPAHLAYHAYNRKRGRMSGQLRLRIRYHQYTGPWFDYLIVSQDEMKYILSGTGWKAAKFLTLPDKPFYTAIIEKNKSL